MELTADQERLVRAGARFADVSPEEFLGECVRMGFDAADGVEPKLTIEGSATDTGSPSVAEAIGFTTQSGLARTIGRAMAAKLEALGVREVELDGVRAHELAEVVQRSREHCKTLV